MVVICVPRVRILHGDNHWKIDVCRKDSLFWTLVLSYVIPYIDNDEHELKRLLQSMVDDHDCNYEGIIQCLQHFNPFLNRFACFYNKELKAFISKFSRKVNNKTEKLRRSTGENHQDLLFHSAASILQCHIQLYLEDKSFYDADSSVQSNLSKCYGERNAERILNLFGKEEFKSDNTQRFSFSLLSSISSHFRKLAFQRIMSQVGVKDTIITDQIASMPDAQKDFFSALLKQKDYDTKYAKITRKLLTSHWHPLSQLSDARFETDPLKTTSLDDIENSVFCAILKRGDDDLLYSFYLWSTLASLTSENSARDPTVCVIENLEQLTEVLLRIEDQYKLSDAKDDCSVGKIVELVKYHLFQSNVCKGIFDIKKKDDTYSSEAEKRKDVIVEIIENYLDVFYMNAPDDSKDSLLYLNNKKHFNFFQFLDSQAALFFYDHDFLLKEKLTVQNDTLKAFESSVARLLFFRKYYYDIVQDIGDTRSSLTFQKRKQKSQLNTISFDNEFSKDVFTFLTFLQRKDFRLQTEEFLSFLKNLEIDEGNKRNCIDPSDVYTLENEPIIKDDMIAKRLKVYLNQAIKVDLDEFPVTGTLAIMRCIQVLGECLHLSTGEMSTVLKSILISHFTCATNLELIDIRDKLSHLKGTNVVSRLMIEKDLSYFKDLQKELKDLTGNFSFTFKLQYLRMKKYCLQSTIGKIHQWEDRYKEEIQIWTKTVANDFEVYKASQKRSHCNKLGIHYLYLVLTNKYKHTNSQLKELILESLETFDKHFENHISAINKRIEQIRTEHSNKKSKVDQIPQSAMDQNGKNKKNIIRQNMTMLNDRLSCAKRLLQFIAVDTKRKPHKQCKLLRQQVDQLEEDIQFEDIGPEKINDVIEVYKSVKDKIYTSLQKKKTKNVKEDPKTLTHTTDSDSTSELANESQFHKLRRMLSNDYPLTSNDKERIIASIPEKFLNRHRIKKDILNSLKNEENHLTPSSLEDKLREMGITKSSKRTTIIEYYNEKNTEKLETTIKDYVQILYIALQENEVKGTNYKEICSKFEFSDEIKQLFGKILLGRPKVKQQNASSTLEFYFDRLTKLKKILIEDFPYINHLWIQGKSWKTKSFNRYKIVSNYLRNPLIRLSVEQLIFDCMTVLIDGKTNLVSLWTKTNYMFNGINLKAVLGHGNPLLECACSLLDTHDFPNELINKILEMISHIDTIEAMLEWKKKSSISIETFLKEMESYEHDEFETFRFKIRECPCWENYACLWGPKKYCRIVPENP